MENTKKQRRKSSSRLWGILNCPSSSLAHETKGSDTAIGIGIKVDVHFARARGRHNACEAN